MVADAQLAALARSVGLAPVVTAVAVALGESGGNANAQGTNSNGTKDTGLWQINDVHRGSIPGAPSETGAWHAWLKVPTNNASAAKWVQSRQGWDAWTVYRSGRYRDFISRAALAAGQNASLDESLGALASNPGAAVDTATQGAVQALTSVPEAIGAVAEAVNDAVEVVIDAGQWLGDPHNWVRVAQVVGGIAAVIAALAVLGVGPAGRAVNKVPGGKLLT